eukprot:6467313-Amphidinium_carterae.2
MLPDQKLLFCVPPKISCSSLKILMIRLIGVATADDICSDGLARLGYVVHQALPFEPYSPEWSGEQWKTFKDWTKKQRDAWGNATGALGASDAMLREAFLSREWTTIQFVRDPWYRAVSSYQDQIERGHHTVNRSEGASDASDFLNFTETRSGWGHHTGEQASACGNPYVDYDYIVKLEDLDNGLLTLISNGVIPRDSVYTGWETCTGYADLTKGPINLTSGQTVETHSALIPKQDVDSIFCNAQTVAAVHERYAEDYKFLSRAGVAYSEPHQCKSKRAL